MRKTCHSRRSPKFHRFLAVAHDSASIAPSIAYMTRTFARLLLWGPRLLGLGLCVFLGLFALDAFSENASLGRTLIAFAIHLVPSLVLLLLVALSWRWEWVGGIACIALAALYAMSVGWRHPDWILLISGPLFIVGALFLWSWRRHDQVRGLA